MLGSRQKQNPLNLTGCRQLSTKNERVMMSGVRLTAAESQALRKNVIEHYVDFFQCDFSMTIQHFKLNKKVKISTVYQMLRNYINDCKEERKRPVQKRRKASRVMMAKIIKELFEDPNVSLRVLAAKFRMSHTYVKKIKDELG